MRSLILILCTALLLAAGFLVYWSMRTPGPGPDDHAPAVAPRTGQVRPEGNGGPGGIVDPWIWHVNQKTRRLTSKMRGARADRQPDGRWLVRKPEVLFFGGDGQVTRLTGSTALVTTQQELSRGSTVGNGMNESPARGQMKDVVVEMYHTAAQQEAGAAPYLTLTMDNASFENESMRVYTEGHALPDRTFVKGEDIPVKVRGDYEFDGRGLEIRWNDRDHRLEFLKVFHGERLVVKDPSKFDAQFGSPPSTRPTARAPFAASSFAELRPDSPGFFAAPPPPARDGQKQPRNTPKPQPASDDEPALYRATFYTDVVVTRGAGLRVASDQMQVDFRQEDRSTTQPSSRPKLQQAPGASGTAADPHVGAGKPSAAAQRPSSRPATRMRAATRPGALPSTRPGASANVSLLAATQPSPATQPAVEPVIVTWTGPLILTPLAENSPVDIPPGQSIVKFSGKPVTLDQVEGASANHAKCATLVYHTTDRSAQLEEGPGVELVMWDDKNTVVHTPRLDFSQVERIAHLYGKSSAVMPLADAASAPAQVMTANWSDQCTLYFNDTGSDKLSISRAELRGDVDVKDPQLHLQSRLLNLDFAPALGDPPPAPPSQPATHPATLPTTHPTTHPATRPAGSSLRRFEGVALRQLDASGAVRAETRDGNGEAHTINADHLKVLTGITPDGQLFAQHLIADGSVVAVDPKQTLTSGYLSVTLSPTTRPATNPATKPTSRPTTNPYGAASASVESLLAHDHVHVISADGSTATAEQLLSETRDGRQSLKLLGNPAIATQDKTILKGPIIQFYPDTQQFSVLGEGSLDAVQQDSPTDTPKPLHVTWHTGMSGDGAANRIDCVGLVNALSVDKDGALDRASSDRVVLTLADAPRPATRPATLPAATTRPASRPASRPSTRPAAFGLAGAKVVRQITFIDRAQLNSTELTLIDVAPPLQVMAPIPTKSTQVDASTITYDPISRRLDIPVEGTLRMEDHTPPATRPAGQASSNSAGDARGQTAIAWQKRLIYDESGATMLIDGDVKMVHRDEGGHTSRLFGDTFTGELEPVPTTQPAPATQPVGASPPKMQVKMIHGHGNIEFLSEKGWIKCDLIDYDPHTHIMTARALPRRRVRVLEPAEGPAQGTERASFDVLRFNVDTWHMEDGTLNPQGHLEQFGGAP